MIWLYLQIIGAPAQRCLSEKDLWAFDRNDFEKACLFLMIDNAVNQDESASEMRKLISKHFTSEDELALWSKDICQNVTINYSLILSKNSFTKIVIYCSRTLPIS